MASSATARSRRRPPTTTVTALFQTPISIAAGSSHACALYASGEAACWGRNLYGQLGDGSQINRAIPVVAPVTGIRQIAPGGYSTGEGSGGQTCALLTGGSVYCWGSNNFGQLGNAAMSTTVSTAAVQVAGISTGVEISMGRYHVCVRDAVGKVFCWGRNSVGEVGDDTQTDRSVPTAVTLPRPAVHVVAGGFHTCALARRQQRLLLGPQLERPARRRQPDHPPHARAVHVVPAVGPANCMDLQPKRR